MEEELEKRKDEIEREVLRRVEEAKRIMEKQLLEELEKQRHAELATQKAREVTCMWTGKTKSKFLLMLIRWVGFPAVLLEVGLFHTTYTYFSVHITSVIEANEIFNIVTQKWNYSVWSCCWKVTDVKVQRKN